MNDDPDFRRWMDSIRTRLAHAEVEVNRKYSVDTYPERTFPTACFPRALFYLETHRVRGYYVLGEALCGGIQQHAWVEFPDTPTSANDYCDGVIFDGVLQRFYDRKKYYESEHVRVWYRFTRDAALWLHKQNLPTYRWNVPLRLPWADFENPLTIGLVEARKYLATAKSRREAAMESAK